MQAAPKSLVALMVAVSKSQQYTAHSLNRMQHCCKPYIFQSECSYM